MRKAMLGLLLVALCSCLCGCLNVQREYVEADVATYEAITPEYLKYVEDDASLDGDEKDLRRNTVAIWEARITAALEND